MALIRFQNAKKVDSVISASLMVALMERLIVGVPYILSFTEVQFICVCVCVNCTSDAISKNTVPSSRYQSLLLCFLLSVLLF